MKAAVLREFKAPLSIEELPSPQLDASEVLVKVEACGVCHSDLHVADGDWPQLVPITKRPLILGHEIAGRVAEKGASVHHLEVGDRVGVPWVYWTCGECDFCCEDSRWALLGRRRASFLCGSDRLSCVETRENPARATIGGLRRRRPGAFGRANWARSGSDCHGH